MAKKRKAPKTFDESLPTKNAKFDIEERFDDSEDDFYAGKDKILLEQSHDVKRKNRIASQEQDIQLSDEEIGGYESAPSDNSGHVEDSSDEDDSDHDSQIEKKPGQEPDDEAMSDEEIWGTNRADYYGDDVIETEEQALEEENEARRLQQKQLRGMTAADFGFDENEWAEQETTSKSQRSIIEKLPEAKIPENATEEQKLSILRARYPEFEPLAEEYATMQAVKETLDEEVQKLERQLQKGAQVGAGLPIKVKQNTLAAYMATIAMYFAIVSSNIMTQPLAGQITAISPLDLHEHTIIQSLARARQLWDQVSKEPVATSLIPGIPATEDRVFESSEPKRKSKASIVVNGTAHSPDLSIVKRQSLKKEPTKSDAVTLKKRKKRSRGKDKVKALEVADLLGAAAADDDISVSEYGDEQPLTEEQYAEKARKRKSLRFYTSQITAKANKRGHASRDAGGDDDMPYKERNRDRQERLMKEAQARGRQEPDDNEFADDEEYDNLLSQRDQNDEYYDTLLNANSKKKADKQAKADAYARAAEEGATVYEEETVGPDGKRAITYAIEKNKGLMPKRSKDVRNPRVKKRKKYDEKMKKLGSMRQLYKGGEGRGGYGGELTGIKTHLVKSVKL